MANPNDITREYSNGEITVIWKKGLCTHSTACFKGLPEVFDPSNQPWVNSEGASSERIINQVKKCPSGALSFYNNTEGLPIEEKAEFKNEYPKIADTNPVPVELKAGEQYSWCTCGDSQKQPFCDGKHREKSNMRSHKFTCTEDEEAWLCMCKQTRNPPYCDGSHNNL